MPPGPGQGMGGMPPRGPPQMMGGPGNYPRGPGAYPSQNQPKKLDPDSIPSPLDVMRADQEMFNQTPFVNYKGAVPPACTTTIKQRTPDCGNCSPRYCRASLYSLPSTSEMAKQSQIPMTLSICALAEPGP